MTRLVFMIGEGRVQDQERTLLDFQGRDERERWITVNDGVMGGVSQGRMAFTAEGTAVFEGILSLENYGGFASVRTRPQAYDLERYRGFVVRVKGDGKRYKLRVRTDDRFDGPAYQADFETEAGAWSTVYVPFGGFVPTFRGRRLTDMPPLDGAQVRQIGFLVADKQAGPFRLEIDWIKAYRNSPS
jgi:monofunctional biosynthetic peptidoglycan transglycosylase